MESAATTRVPQTRNASAAFYLGSIAPDAIHMRPGTDGKDKQVVHRARRVQRFLSQPFHVAEAFTNKPGVYVKIEDTVRAFKEICEGKHDDIPEQAFYMRGGIEEVLEAAKEMAEVE